MVVVIVVIVVVIVAVGGAAWHHVHGEKGPRARGVASCWKREDDEAITS